ncbi:glutamate--tRNA ligase [Myxococcota bacterium]|nr:glutamate--tRNA ligase [Myxococcota bacterium]
MTKISATRFAPSPTGHLHVGGARTALFNRALARKLGDSFLVRIEDTDQARSSETATLGILEDLSWLGINWDVGPVHGKSGGDPNNIGPFYQSQRLSIYKGIVERLLETDLAYPAFETPEQLDKMRKDARQKKVNFRYRRDISFNRTNAIERMQREPHVIRFKMPDGPIEVTDQVLGEIAFGDEHVEDFIILKRDGFPTYHLAVVVDDEFMGIGHVLRGQEHLNNTPRQVALQKALHYATPLYYHVPLIFNQDGSKMSKRDKDKVVRSFYRETINRSEISEDLPKLLQEEVALWEEDKNRQLSSTSLSSLAERLEIDLPEIDVEDFRKAGYLPETVCNFLSLLGFSPGKKDNADENLERFDQKYLCENFETAKLGHSNAKFDRKKLLAFSAEDINNLTPDSFLKHWEEWAKRYEPWVFDSFGLAKCTLMASTLQSRCKTLADLTSQKGPGAFLYLDDRGVVFDDKAVAKFLMKGEPSGLKLLSEVRSVITNMITFNPEDIELRVQEFANEHQVGLGKVAQPLRVAVTGIAASPPLGVTLNILGKTSVLTRIDSCLSQHLKWFSQN